MSTHVHTEWWQAACNTVMGSIYEPFNVFMCVYNSIIYTNVRPGRKTPQNVSRECVLLLHLMSLSHSDLDDTTPVEKSPEGS